MNKSWYEMDQKDIKAEVDGALDEISKRYNKNNPETDLRLGDYIEKSVLELSPGELDFLKADA